jgi:hypothetical protein
MVLVPLKLSVTVASVAISGAAPWNPLPWLIVCPRSITITTINFLLSTTITTATIKHSNPILELPMSPADKGIPHLKLFPPFWVLDLVDVSVVKSQQPSTAIAAMQQPQDIYPSPLTSEISSSEQTTSDEATSTDTSESTSGSASDTSSSDDSSPSDITTSSEEEEEDTSDEESDVSANQVTKSGDDATPPKPSAGAANDKAVSSEPISTKSATANNAFIETAIATVKSIDATPPSPLGDDKSVGAPSSDSSPISVHSSPSQNLSSDDTAKSPPQLPPELVGGWGKEPEPAPWEWQHMPFDYMGILEEQRRTVFWEFRETRDGKGEWVLPNYQGIGFP